MLILIAPKSDTADAVLTHLAGLSASRIVRPFVWWSIPAAPTPTPSLDVDLVVEGSVSRMSLARALDQWSTDSVAFLACCPLGAEDAGEDGFAPGVLAHLATAQQVIAFQGAARCTMVVIPAVVGQAVPRSLVRFDWLSTVLVAPEDRRDPEAPNFLAAEPARHPRHAAHALAVIGDLFSPTARATDRLLESLPDCNVSSHEAGICVVRTFSRIVDGGDWYDRITRQAASATTVGWPNPNPAKFERIDDVEAMLDDIAGSFLVKHRSTLGLSEVEPFADQARESLSILAALRALLRHSIQAVRRLVLRSAGNVAGSVVDWSAASIERVARLVGADDVIVNRWRSERRIPVEDVEAILVAGPPSADYGPASLTWRDLLGTCFALVDGSDLPEHIDSPRLRRGDRRLIIANPFSIAPDPASPEAIAPEPSDGWLASDVGVEASTVGAEEAEGDPPATLGEAIHDADVVPADGLGGRTDLLHAVGSGISETIRVAVAASETPATHSQTAVGDGPPDEQASKTGEPNSATEPRGHWRGSLIGVGVASIVALGLTVTVWATLDVLPRIGALVLIVMVWILSVGILALRAARSECDEIDRLTREHQAAVHGAIVRTIRRSDADRLRMRYREFVDWAEVAGWFIHHPLTESADTELTPTTPVDPAHLPMAGRLAQPAEPTHIVRVADAVRRDAFSAGWLRNHFREVSTSVMTDVLRDQHFGRDVETLELPDPFGDTSEDPASSRKRFLQAVRAGAHRHVDGSHLGDAMLEALGQYSLVDVVGDVRLVESEDQLPPILAHGGDRSGAVASDDDHLAVMEFLSLDDVADPVVLLPDHWCTPGQYSEKVVQVLSGVDGRGSRLTDVAGPPRFHEPMHLVVTRAEITKPVVVGQLTSFQESEAPPDTPN